jgi:hypothetical protein
MSTLTPATWKMDFTGGDISRARSISLRMSSSLAVSMVMTSKVTPSCSTTSLKATRVFCVSVDRVVIRKWRAPLW